MKLKYPTRSRFLAPCEDAIRSNMNELLIGEPISVYLSTQRYNREVQITISQDDQQHFQSDWVGTDPTRFSARIRAAAWALFNQGCYGTFRAIHQDGLLKIEKISGSSILYKRVASSQFTDGVRINMSFHNIFNPPTNGSFASKGRSRSIKIKFNDKEFTAKYLYENPSKVDREMQSIRFSKDLKNEFTSVFPDQSGYFSIILGATINNFVFDVVAETDTERTENFAKSYIRQEQAKFDSKTVEKQRRDRLKHYDKTKQASKKNVSTRSVNQSDPILKEDIKQLYRYKCQICAEQIKKAGWTEELDKLQEFEYLSADAHHVIPLEQEGPDTPHNIICVCPNCHRKLHTGELSIEFESYGPFCRNQLSGEALPMNVDQDHSFNQRTS